MKPQLTDAQDKTIQALVAASKRVKSVPIRNDFVQTGDGKHTSPGLLGKLIKTSNGRSLDLYLLHRLAASSDPWDTKRAAAVWARALGLGDEAYGKDAVSRCWTKLESIGLILRERESKQAKITSLQEDGSLKPYTAPKGRYFTLPLEYWTEGWYRTLSYPGKAALLISSSLSPGFYLPGRLANKWYGISADTLHAGFDDLSRHEILTYDEKVREDYTKAEVAFTQRHYTLVEPFGKDAKGLNDRFTEFAKLFSGKERR
jgi:hypothetical protein